MKSSRKVGLIVALICAAVIILVIISIPFHQYPSTSIIKPLENSTLTATRTLNIPSNQSAIIVKAEQASFVKDGNEVNVTIIQAANESTAQLLFEVVRASYLAQGLMQEDITISSLHGTKFYTSGRPYIVLLVKNNQLIQSCSFDENLAIAATNSQIKD